MLASLSTSQSSLCLSALTMTRPSLEHVENIAPLCEKLTWSTWWACSVSSSVLTRGICSVRRLYSHFHDFAPVISRICITHMAVTKFKTTLQCDFTWPQANTRIDLEIPSKQLLPQIVVLAQDIPLAAGPTHAKQVLHGRVACQVQKNWLGQVSPRCFLDHFHFATENCKSIAVCFDSRNNNNNVSAVSYIRHPTSVHYIVYIIYIHSIHKFTRRRKIILYSVGVPR